MTKLPRDTKGKDAIRVLKKFDWEVVHIKGSHFHLGHDDYDHIITVPCHPKPLIPKILHNIIKLAGLTIEEFIAHR